MTNQKNKNKSKDQNKTALLWIRACRVSACTSGFSRCLPCCHSRRESASCMCRLTNLGGPFMRDASPAHAGVPNERFCSLGQEALGTAAVARPSTPNSQRLPTLELSFSIGHVAIDDDYFKFKEGGLHAIVVRVRNKPATRGETAPHARDIFAQIDFDSSIGRSTVERAYWLDRDNSQISLAGGDEAWVLIGVPESGVLSSWHNRNTYSRRLREWSSPNFEPESRTMPWGQGKLTGQIYIISHNLRGNVTLEHSRFILTREEWFGDFGKVNMRFVDEA